jgi:hypothetical protein
LRSAFVDLSANCASINMRIRRWVGILTFAACALSDGPPCQNPSRGDASAHGGVRNNCDLDFTGLVAAAFEEIDHRVSYIAAKSLERVAFDVQTLNVDVQTLNVGMLNIPDAGVIIMSSLEDYYAHLVRSFNG